MELRYTKNPQTEEEKKAAPKAKEAHDAAVQGDTVGDPSRTEGAGQCRCGSTGVVTEAVRPGEGWEKR